MSWQHILICVVIYIIVVGAAILLAKFGKKDKHDIILKSFAILDFIGLVVGFCLRDGFFGPGWLYVLRMDLPFFICSTIHIALPLAAFGRGKLKQAMLNYMVFIGPLATITGTILAANYFNPETSIWIMVWNCIIHVVSGIVALYLVLRKRVEWKKYLWVPYTLVGGMFIVATLINYLFPLMIPNLGQPNYMFLDNPEGTAFSLFFDWFKDIKIKDFPFGHRIIYPLFHLVINYAYFGILQITALVCIKIKGHINQKKALKNSEPANTEVN